MTEGLSWQSIRGSEEKRNCRRGVLGAVKNASLNSAATDGENQSRHRKEGSPSGDGLRNLEALQIAGLL